MVNLIIKSNSKAYGFDQKLNTVQVLRLNVTISVSSSFPDLIKKKELL